MAATWTSWSSDHSVFDADRQDVLGVVLSAGLPLAGLVIVHAGAEAAGLASFIIPAPFGLPAWMGMAALLVMLPMWGIARWLVARHGHEGHVAGWWVVALMAAVIIAPFAMAAVDVLMASMVSMLLLLTGIIAAARTAALSGPAAALLLPGIIWTGAGALVGFSIVAGGWSPPFALTESHGH